ncbi:MAG: ATPase, T2SS/T4P/T4SS family, partial [Planctomycetaceae bacterium]
MASRYYIRFRGRKLGPLTVDRLHSLAKRGRFARHYEVSTDGKRWSSAAEYPELFPDSAAEEEGLDDEFGGMDDEMPEDPWDDDPGEPRKKKRRGGGGGSRRRSSGGQSFSPPPPPPIDDEPIDGPAPPKKRTTTKRTTIRERVPLAQDDDLDAPIVEEIIEEEAPSTGGSKRPRRIKRVRRRGGSSSDDDEEIIEEVGGGGGGRTVVAGGAPANVNVNVTVEQPTRREPSPIPTGGGRPAPSLFDVASAKSAQLHDASDEGEEDEETPKKKRRFFGLFGGKEDETASLDPYLKKMYDLTEVLGGQLKFTLEDVILIGSGGEEIHVREHMRTGDGADILGLLTMLAFQSKSSDIHFEPCPDGADVRMRIDGALVQLVRLPRGATNKTYGVCKVLCEADLGSRREIQEGNYSVLAPGRRVDYRVSFTPSVHGQKLAIRVLDLMNSPQSLKQLGAPPRLLRTLRSVMAQNAGMVLMCGPTGSGKTTTLYSLIRSIDVKTRNVMTLEDPVEYQIDGVTQMSIDSDHNKGFKEMLPAMLRQDPDVLLIGEIRDAISAQISMQATMTGHLVLSTLHAPDTLSTLYRLLDLNADPNMVGAALDIILSQRLV